MRKSLGILFYERTIAVSEVEYTPRGCRVTRCAEFEMDEGTSLDTIGSQPSKFAAFFKEKGFQSRKASVGLSARRMMAATLTIPPIADELIRQETIRIQLERELDVDVSEIVFDCWDRPSETTESVLAVMTLKKTLAAINAFLAAARITPLWITHPAMGLDLAADNGPACHIICYPSSLDILMFQDSRLKTLLTVSRKNADVFDATLADAVSRQVRRSLWALSASSDEPPCTVWTTPDEMPIATQQLTQSLKGLASKSLKSLDGASSCSSLTDLAGHLAGRMMTTGPINVNFLNGRHRRPATAISRQWWVRIAAAAAVCLLLLGLYGYGWYEDSRAIRRYQQEFEAMRENVDAAEKMIDQVGYAGQWFRQDPVHLENLRELTRAFPPTGDIWLTSLAVDPSLNQVIAGRAAHEDVILDLVDKLKANPLFQDIKLLYIRKMGATTDVMTFAINFNCRQEQ